MPIIPREPIRPWESREPFWPWDLERFFEEEYPDFGFRISPRIPSVRVPKMDIYETDKEVVAEVELPGVDPKDIEVEVKNNVLRVEAKKEEKKEEKGKDYYKKELSRGYYKRAVPLPVEVIGEKAEATFEEGILKIVIPKKEPRKKEEKKIKIKVKGARTA